MHFYLAFATGVAIVLSTCAILLILRARIT